METNVTIYQKKTAVMLRREMASVPAVMDALNPVERSIFLASTAKAISEYSERELIEEFVKAFKYIARDIGCRIPTEKKEFDYLVVRICELLKRYYSNLTMRDFRMSFEMSITGELDDYLPRMSNGQPDKNHYQQFNADYVCKVLNAYKLRRASVMKKANNAMPQEPEKPIEPEKEKELMDRTKLDCIHAFEQFKENGYMPDISPIAEMLYYEILSGAGLAPEIVVTLDEQKAILQRTINQLARRGMVGDMRRLEIAGPSAPELQHGAFTFARKKALKAAFAKIAADGICLTDYIKFE